MGRSPQGTTKASPRTPELSTLMSTVVGTNADDSQSIFLSYTAIALVCNVPWEATVLDRRSRRSCADSRVCTPAAPHSSSLPTHTLFHTAGDIVADTENTVSRLASRRERH